MPNLRCFSLLVDIPAHSLISGLCHISALSGRARNAESLVLVPAVIADPCGTCRTLPEVRSNLLLCLVKCSFLLLAPLGAVAATALIYEILATFNRIAQISQFAAENSAQQTEALANLASLLLFAIGG